MLKKILAGLAALLLAVAPVYAGCDPGPPASANIHASSGNVAAATASVTLTSTLQAITRLTRVEFFASGATGASVVTGTITGLAGGTRSFTIVVPAGATTAISPNPLVLDFSACPLQASATGVSIVVSVPSLGAGNTNATLNADGF